MAIPKKKIRVSKPTVPVRTGGFMGDPDMEALEKYAREGCGVSEEEEEVGDMPNEKFLGKIGKEIV